MVANYFSALLFLCGAWAHSLRSSSNEITVHLITSSRGTVSYDVSGAGDTRVNGRYEQVDGHYDTYGGHPMYRPVDSSGKQILTAAEIYKQAGSWIIRHEKTPGSLYVGEGETPDKAEWMVGPAGKAPVPVVSLSGATAAKSEPKSTAAPTTAATTTAAARTTTAAAAAKKQDDKEDLIGVGALVGLLLLLFCLLLLCITCFLIGGGKIPHEGDTYEADIDHSYGHKLGMEFKWEGNGLVVTAIDESTETQVKHFNRSHGDDTSDPCCIEVGHVLLEVNGIHNNENKMRAELEKQVPLNLIFRRHERSPKSQDPPAEIESNFEAPKEPPADQLEVDAEGASNPAAKGGGGDSGRSQSQLDDILAERRARTQDAGTVGSQASKKTGLKDEDAAAALARRRERDHGVEVPHIGSAASTQSAVGGELAARLRKQREAEEVLGGGTPKVTDRK